MMEDKMRLAFGVTYAGLSAAGVALVAAAAVGLVKGQCKDRTTTILCCLSATIAYYYQTAWLFPLLLLIGGLVTLTERWSKPIEADVSVLCNCIAWHALLEQSGYPCIIPTDVYCPSSPNAKLT